ncbi:GNAT family N-acetyltransferase [bacterium SCSIO 12741]|nr:GNAT family N-acetyltransferase [bacterium SCSIO 12741]
MDRDKLISIINEIYPSTYGYLWTDQGEKYLSQIYSMENLTLELKDSESPYYFITHHSEIVGILKFRKELPKQHIRLQRIYIHPKHQGKSIGKALFGWIEKTYQSDFQTVSLEVMKSESKAIRFYEKMGMQLVGNSSLNFNHLIPEFKQTLIYQKQLK